MTGLEVTTKSWNVPETRTKRATERKVQTEAVTESQAQTHGITDNVPTNTKGTASGTTCKKVHLALILKQKSQLNYHGFDIFFIQ